MRLNLSTQALARGSGRRPWVTIGIWILGVVAAGIVVSMFLADALTTDDYFTNKPESERAWELLQERGFEFPPNASDIVIVRSQSFTVDSAEFQQFVESLYQDLTSLGERAIEGGVHYYQSGDDSLVSEDRHTTILPFLNVDDIDRVLEVISETNEADDFQVLVTGEAAFNRDFEETSRSDLEVEFRIGIPAAIIILILVFGALLAATVPLVIALVSIAVAVGATALIGQAFTFSFFVTNMIAMMGLAVGVDYSLFIVARYREERSRGLDKLDAIAMAGTTASRAVFFSGMTVVLALIGMLVVPYSIFRSLGAGAILVVIVSVLAALTLLPAVLSIMGDKVNSLRIPFIGWRENAAGEREGRFWDMVARAVMRRPVVSLLATVVFLVAAAIPYFDINTGFPSISTFPDNLPSKQGFVVLEEDFSFGAVNPAFIVIDGQVESEAVQRSAQALQSALRSDNTFDFEQSKIFFVPESNLALIEIPLMGDPGGDQAVKAIRRLRDQYIPEAFSNATAEVLVTGETASNIDFFDVSNDYFPFVVAFVLGLSFVLLMVVFRSVVVPLKAIIMNLLSVGAAYGLMVLVFQKGVGAELFGFEQVDVIAAWIPLFLFSVLFGLSMDYHVFLLSRIRERYDQTQDNAGSVAFGLRSTAGLITGAALIMVAVFGGFAMGDLVMFQQVGFGLAVAVFLDATIIRSVLVPASMKLLGRANWYFPSILRWLPDVRVDGDAPASKSRTAASAAD